MSKVMVLSTHFDLPARAGALEQVTYTGHDSCSYCDEHGEVIKTGLQGHVMVFPFRNTGMLNCGQQKRWRLTHTMPLRGMQL